MAEEGVKLFGEDGLIFDHTNPLDYLSFVPGLGILGVGAKVLSKLGKLGKVGISINLCTFSFNM